MLPGPAALLFSRTALDPVHELNAHFLTILLECASRPEWATSAWGLALGGDLARCLPPVQADLALSPISLVEFSFPATGAAPAPAAPCPIAPARALELSQLALTLAWTLARGELPLSCLVFGLPRPAARTLAATSAPQLQVAAEAVAGEIRPRWLAAPRIWRQLLQFRQRETQRAGPLHIRLLLRQLADRKRATCANDELRHART